MRQITLFAAALLAGGASLFAADPQLLNMAPPGAQTFAGINVEQAKTSQFGQFVLSNLPVNGDFEAFVNSTGFDPRRDLREVLMVSSTPVATATGMPAMNGLVLAKGTFNIPQIMAAAAADKKVIVAIYAGAQLLTIDGTQALAVVDATTAVAGDVADVKGALDRRSGTNVIDPAIMTLINQLSTTEDAWSISTASLSSFIPSNDAGPSAVLGGIQQASGGVKFGSTVQVDVQAVAASAQDATSLSDVIKMLSQMMAMHGNGNGNGAAELAGLLKGLAVTTDGSTVKISLSLPEDQIETLFKMAKSHGSAAQRI
jgi:hypothetical protein